MPFFSKAAEEIPKVLFAELILVDGIDVALLNSKLGTANLTFELSLPHSIQKHLNIVLHQLTNR